MSRKMNQVIFCINLDNLMYASGLSASDVARGTGLSDRDIRYYRNGYRAPNISNALILADYFHVSVDEMARSVHDEWRGMPEYEWF